MKTEPIAPDPWAFGIVASLSALGVVVYSTSRRDGWLYTLVMVLMVCTGFAILYASAHRKYKSAMESYRLLMRATSTRELPETGTIYNIDGVVSMRTKDGGWMDIGEGAGTFQILPPRATRPSIVDPERGHPAFRQKKQTPPAR